MLSYVWPIGVVVISNIVYQIAAKSVPSGIDPFASLTITYVIGALTSLILYYLLNKGGNIVGEFGKINWATIIMGIVIVGLEVGYIYAYKAGWEISKAQIVQSVTLAIILIFVGYVLYQEKISWTKILGIIVCLAGLGIINL